MKMRKKFAGSLVICSAAFIFTGCKAEVNMTLDENTPIPAYDGSLNLESYSSRKLCLDVKVPEGMKVTEDKESIQVKGENYTVYFQPADKVAMETVIADVNARKELKNYKDVDIKETNLCGHFAEALIYNIKDAESSDHPTVYAVIDYEESEKAADEGLIISVVADEKEDAYEFLQDQKVLALLENISILERGTLDTEQPIPDYDDSLTTEVYTNVADHLKIQVPEGMSVEDTDDGVLLHGEDGIDITLLPVTAEEMDAEKKALNEKIASPAYYHAEKMPTTWKEYSADAYIYSVLKDAEDLPTLELIVDYGTSVGGKDGLIIRAAYNGNLYAYDLLKRPEVLAVINGSVPLTGGMLPDDAFPEYNGTLTLTELNVPGKNLILQIPEGMEAKETDSSVEITGEDGLTVTFEPVRSAAELEKEIQDYAIHFEEDKLIDPEKIQMSVSDYEAIAEIYNRKDTEKGAIRIQADYEDTIVGGYAGLLIHVDMEEIGYAYDWLQDQRVLALISTAEVVEGDILTPYYCNGIACEFPGRYQVTENETDGSIYAHYQRREAPALSIMIQPGRDTLKNIPFKRIDTIVNDLEEVVYGSETCLWRYEETGSGSIHLYRPYGRFQTLDITVSLDQKTEKESLQEILEDPDFIAFMESISAVPEAEANHVESEWDKQATDPTLFGCEDGVITYFIGTDTNIRIPEFINGYTVTKLGDQLFANTELTSIEIPQTVTAIGDGTFEGCPSLETITLFSEVTELGDNCFRNCTALKEVVTGPNDTVLGTGLFSGCSSLEHFSLPEKITEIPDRCFEGCTSLLLQIPDSVTKIGSRALFEVGTAHSCQEQIIVIPKGVELAPEAFSLNYVYMKGVHTPEEFPSNFDTCYANAQIYLCSDASYSEMNAVDDYLKSMSHYNDNAFFQFEPGTFPIMTADDLVVNDRMILGGQDDRTEIVVGEFLKREEDSDYATRIVAEHAFADSDITALWIGPYTQSIWEGAFKNCRQLKDIWALANMWNIHIEKDAFSGIAPDAVIHLPGRMTEEEKENAESIFRNAGIPENVTFDYYFCE